MSMRRIMIVIDQRILSLEIYVYDEMAKIAEDKYRRYSIN